MTLHGQSQCFKGACNRSSFTVISQQCAAGGTGCSIHTGRQVRQWGGQGVTDWTLNIVNTETVYPFVELKWRLLLFMHHPRRRVVPLCNHASRIWRRQIALRAKTNRNLHYSVNRDTHTYYDRALATDQQTFRSEDSFFSPVTSRNDCTTIDKINVVPSCCALEFYTSPPHLT